MPASKVLSLLRNSSRRRPDDIQTTAGIIEEEENPCDPIAKTTQWNVDEHASAMNAMSEDILLEGVVEKRVFTTTKGGQHLQQWQPRHITLTANRIVFRHVQDGPVREEVQLCDIVSQICFFLT